MKKFMMSFAALYLIFSLTGCTLSLMGTPTAMILPTLTPAPVTAASATSTFPAATSTLPLPTLTPLASPAATAVAPTAAGGAPSAGPSGPYAVIGVLSTDVLNLRSAPGAGNTISGSFPANAVNVMRTGAASTVDGASWVQVQNPSGGNGWVNSAFLTEYVTPAAFCADTRVNALIASLGNAFKNSDGEALAALVSPLHAMEVRLWRHANVINYDREHARWVFASTYSHNWGADGASGLDTIGSFQAAVLPKLQDVFAVSTTLGCNDPAVASAFSVQPWPEEYTNINYYSVLKPGTPGVDLDWRVWLVGVEYVQGQPYVFSLIHFQWEP